MYRNDRKPVRLLLLLYYSQRENFIYSATTRTGSVGVSLTNQKFKTKDGIFFSYKPIALKNMNNRSSSP